MSYSNFVLPITLLAVACVSSVPADRLAQDAETARPLTEPQILEQGLASGLVRALPQGQDTPVFALFDSERVVVGFQFELPVELASLQAHGLRRMSRRLSPDLPAAVWWTPGTEPHLARLAVMTSNPVWWRVKAAADIPPNIDAELLDLLWTDDTAVLHAVGPDWLELEFSEPAGHRFAALQTDESLLKNPEFVQNSLWQGWIRLPID